MNYPMALKQWRDRYSADRVCAQELSWNHDNFKGCFHVCDLWDCSEDAIIGRDLFDAQDFIHTIEFGMGLARKGYTGIDVEEIIVENQEDEDV